MYITTPRSDAHTIAPRLQKCLADVSDWCGSRRLQLNKSKTKIIWLGSKASLDILSQSTESVRDLGAYLDSELNMRAHIAKTTHACFYQIRRLRQICCLLYRDVTANLVAAFVLTTATHFSRLCHTRPWRHCNGSLTQQHELSAIYGHENPSHQH